MDVETSHEPWNEHWLGQPTAANKLDAAERHAATTKRVRTGIVDKTPLGTNCSWT